LAHQPTRGEESVNEPELARNFRLEMEVNASALEGKIGLQILWKNLDIANVE
jgi:hypothetical protein